MKRHLRVLGAASITTVVSIAGCHDDGGASAATLDGGVDAPALEPFKATVRRTSAGVPHVHAEDLGGVGYGYGYVFADDNLCVLAEDIMTIRGERAKYFGGTVGYDLGLTSSKNNVNSDAVYKMLATKDAADRSRAESTPDIQAAVRGYAAGFSRYVREIKAGQHEGRHVSCRNEPWLREIDDEDLYLRYYKLALLSSSATLIDAIAAAQPVSEGFGPPVSAASAAHVGDREMSARVEQGLASIAPKLMAYKRGQFGSNMYAFGSDLTGGGGIQVGNPHFPWYGGERLYQVHLTVPGKMDVEGASLYGLPFVLIGFTDTFAWSHTVSTAYRFTPYALTLKAGDPLTYIQDGQEKRITPVDIPVDVKGDDGTVHSQNVRLYRSEYGPMVYLGESLFDWTAARAFTIRDANAENFRLLRNYARWNMAKSLQEFEAIQSEEVSAPWVNTGATDKNGSLYYADVSVVPNVPDDLAKACEVPTLSRLISNIAPGLPLLDGSKSACNWKIDADSPQPGTFGPSHLPKTERKDWIVNCNDSFWLTNTKAPITGFAQIIGRQGYEQSLRTRLCHQQVLDRLAGTDGLPGRTVTVDALKQIVLGSRVFSAERFKTQVTDALCVTPSIQLTKDPMTNIAVTPPVDVAMTLACDTLKAWDGRDNADSKGTVVWDEFWFRVEQILGRATVYKVPFDAADPINTPRDMDVTLPEVAQALAGAVRAVQQAGFAVDAPRSAVSYAQGKGGAGDRVPVPGGFQQTGVFTVLESAFSVVASAHPTLQPNTGYGPINFGNSYMQIVAFGPNGVDASTFTAYSLSADPASPHFDDYTRLYSQKQWLKAAFTEAEIAADTTETVELSQ